jgi:ribosomal-protein-alanine N-acetyltransferase
MSVLMVAIEPIGKLHLSLVQKHASHPLIGATSTIPHPYPVDGAARWFERIAPNIHSGVSRVFAIKYNGDFCGVMSVNHINRKERTAEIDYWVAAELHGRGIATRAAYLAISDIQRFSNVTTIFSGCLLRNVASIRVLEKIGFSETARTVIKSGKYIGESYCRFTLNL